MISDAIFSWNKDEFLLRFPYFGEHKSFHVKSEDGYTRHPLAFFQDMDSVEFKLDANDPFISSILSTFHSFELKILPIGYLIPDKRVELAIPVLRFDARSQNALLRNGVRFLSELILLSVQDLSDFSNLGSGSINKMLIQMIKISIIGDDFLGEFKELPYKENTDRYTFEEMRVVKPSNFAISSAFLRTTNSVWGNLSILDFARKMESVGVDISRLEKSFVFDDPKLLVKEGDSDHFRSWQSLFDKFNPRQSEVFYKRVIMRNSETLEAIGRQLNCTRENVRQIELHTKNQMLLASQERNSTLATLVIILKTNVRGIVRVNDLLESEPWLEDSFVLRGTNSDFTVRLLDFLVGITPEISVHSDCIMPTEALLLLHDVSKGNQITGSAEITFESWKYSYLGPEATEKEADQILREFGVKRVGSYLISVSAPLGVQIEALLKTSKVSMDVLALQEFFGTLFSPKYLIAALQSDPRFVRTNKGLWGLSSESADTSRALDNSDKQEAVHNVKELSFPDVLVLKQEKFNQKE